MYTKEEIQETKKLVLEVVSTMGKENPSKADRLIELFVSQVIDRPSPLPALEQIISKANEIGRADNLSDKDNAISVLHFTLGYQIGTLLAGCNEAARHQ